MAGRNIFVVHGRDEAFLAEVEQTLLRFRTEPVILRDQADKGNTIIEKLEAISSTVDLVVVLFTPDDILYHKVEDFWESLEREYRKVARLRNNVLLEMGYFHGKLGRDKIVVLKKPHPNWDLPSDWDGVVYIPVDEAGKWKNRLATEIHDRGVNVHPGWAR